jgi:hypothetical protein
VQMRKALAENGVIGEEQEKFFQVMNSPDTFKMDNLVKYYQALTGSAPIAKEDIAKKQKEMEDRIRRGQAPLPAGVPGSSQEAPKKDVTDEDIFNESLFTVAKNQSERFKMRTVPLVK